jgi:hypothetical protein
MGGEYSSWKKTCFILLPENSLVTIVELDLCSVSLLETIFNTAQGMTYCCCYCKALYAMNACMSLMHGAIRLNPPPYLKYSKPRARLYAFILQKII